MAMNTRQTRSSRLASISARPSSPNEREDDSQSQEGSRLQPYSLRRREEVAQQPLQQHQQTQRSQQLQQHQQQQPPRQLQQHQQQSSQQQDAQLTTSQQRRSPQQRPRSSRLPQPQQQRSPPQQQVAINNNTIHFQPSPPHPRRQRLRSAIPESPPRIQPVTTPPQQQQQPTPADRPFACSGCPGRYTSHSNLNRHISGNRCAGRRTTPSTCPVLETAFNTFAEMRQHLKRVHPVENNTRLEEEAAAASRRKWRT